MALAKSAAKIYEFMKERKSSSGPSYTVNYI
jgi:hypothetical protein